MGAQSSTLTQQGQIFNNQADDRNALAAQDNQLQGLVNHGSPLAQAQMQAATNQNMQNSAGMIASAKGINPAMAARTAAYNNANTGQVAANQSAQTTAQTQLGAQSQLSNNINNAFNADTGSSNQLNALNYQQNQYNAGNALQYYKSFLSFGGSLLGGAANGGMVPKKYAQGGDVNSEVKADMNNNSADQILSQTEQAPALLKEDDPYSDIAGFFDSLNQQNSTEPSSQSGKMMKGLNIDSVSPEATDLPESSANTDNAKAGLQTFARGGKTNKVSALVSPGETYLRPEQVKSVAKGKADPLKIGERIPGTPKVRGNSYANDTVPKKLESGGIVIPNSVMQSSDPANNAYKFVQAVLAQKSPRGKK